MTLLRFLPKYLLASSSIFLAMGCSSNTNTRTFEQLSDVEKALPDTLIYKSNVMAEDGSFLILRMNPAPCRVELTDSVIPNINDSTIALCVWKRLLPGNCSKNSSLRMSPVIMW